jgi:hypothetical protein
MPRIKQLIFRDGNEAYVSLFVATIAVLLTWPVVFINGTQLNVGDSIDINWLTFLNMYSSGYILFVGMGILFGIAAFALAIGSWKRVLIVVALLAIITFCGLGSFTGLAFGNSYSYGASTSIQFRDKSFKIIHAFQNGDMIVNADYLLLECNLIESDCKVTDKFEDYRYDPHKSKPVSFYLEPSDNALYIKVGDETKLVSKA